MNAPSTTVNTQYSVQTKRCGVVLLLMLDYSHVHTPTESGLVEVFMTKAVYRFARRMPRQIEDRECTVFCWEPCQFLCVYMCMCLMCTCTFERLLQQ